MKKYWKYSLIAALIGLTGCGGSGVSSVFPTVHFATTPQAGEYPDIGAVVLIDNATLEYEPAKNNLSQVKFGNKPCVDKIADTL